MKNLFLCLIFYPVLLFSQQSPISAEKELSELIVKCDTLLNSNNYKQLIVVATKGIEKAKNKHYFLSRFNYFKAYGYEYDNNLYEKAVPYYEKSLDYSKKGRHLKEETLALMRLNYLYYSTKQFSKRDQLIDYIKKVLDTTKSIYTQGILNGSLGEYYLDQAAYEKFIGYKLKAIEYRKKFPKDDARNLVNIGISYSQIASAYIKMKQYKKGIEYSGYAQPYLKTSDNATAFLYNDYIKCYVELENLDSIKKYYNGIHKLVSQNEPLHLNISSANRYMAEYFIAKNQINTASNYADKAVLYALKSNDEEILMEANISKGKLEFAQKKYPEAIKTLNSASTYAYEFDKESFITINKKLSQCYEALGDWQNAYKYHTIYSQSNEVMLTESGKQSIANAEAKYQNQYKQEKINTLSTENKLKNLQIENTRKQQIYLGIGFVLLVVIAGLLFKQSRNRRKSNEKLQLLNQELDQANKTKALFFSILNHDLRSPIANLIHFLHLQHESPELLDEESKVRLQYKTLSGAENLLTSMEDILLWSKGQMENFQPHLKNVTIHSLFEDTKTHFSSIENIEMVFENPENIQLNTDEDYLKTIIRNLTGNAIKACEKIENPIIIWKSWQQNSQTFLTISDNGPGGTEGQFKALYDEKEVSGIKTGLGLHLIRDLGKAIDCTVTVESKLNSGTTFKLTF
ncbi:HAMP domain-containing sensor histidine kinase [Flavobacterium sp. GT3R68]|uniref:tetratricopeptide repeat-containing sensor histidine kinase n=1 Tax=Flavobacterium sp. GT3R68 TaxID=2594437 RepID=UPI000F868A7E|nr:HAMP domain-containing sensor histidine kinase [Flavobacterium sp. GT3R68]RTY91378.1 GHKL domain-containing protein [Flavobacterium sp. GSN2]TRW94004.1 GHKL domain-containing protein [Flavobacterium sp. GT3R68]